jgi:hypothetical protein
MSQLQNARAKMPPMATHQGNPWRVRDAGQALQPHRGQGPDAADEQQHDLSGGKDPTTK